VPPDSDQAEQLTVPQSRPVVSLRHVSKTFPGQRALSDVTLDLHAGEIHALLGVNGSGKSTLIKILDGFHEADDGSEIVMEDPDGEPLQVRCVHQGLGLVDGLNAMDNVGLRAGYRHGPLGWISWKQQREATRALLDRFEGFDVSLDNRLGEADPFHRTQVAIAGVLADWDGSGLLILDEPTAALPKPEVDRLFRLVRSVRDAGIAVLYVSHRLNEIFEIADRITVLREGRLVATRRIDEVDHDGLVGLMLAEEPRTGSSADGDPAADGTPVPERPAHGAFALAVRGLRTPELESVSFEVAEGEVLGVAGLLGSGREELPYALIGARAVYGGEVLVGGTSVPASELNPRRAKRMGIAFVPANRGEEAIIGGFGVARNITLPWLSRFRQWTAVRMSDESRSARSWVDELGIVPRDPAAAIEILSGGNQQKAIVARALGLDPKVLVLAAPTAGVDIGAKGLIYERVRIEAARGRGVLVASSDLMDFTEICSRVLVLSDGQFVDELRGEQISEDSIQRAMFRARR
jgi:ribose transport system ATP-binding protein